MSERMTMVDGARAPSDPARARVLEDTAVHERTIDASGIPTPVLEGGKGPPIVLLHGVGVSPTTWVLLLPHLLGDFRVVAPDLPGHGASGGTAVTPRGALDWLSGLIDETCHEQPILLGHNLGGAIAALFAIERGAEIERLVLVDSLGLVRFRPTPRFALAMLGFVRRPNERSFERMMRQCAWDLDGVRERMGPRWKPFVEYNLTLARSPRSRDAGRMLRTFGLRRIPEDDLARIAVATSLVWGRDDPVSRFRPLRGLAERLGWPLYALDDCADDPPLDRPRGLADAIGGRSPHVTA